MDTEKDVEQQTGRENMKRDRVVHKQREKEIRTDREREERQAKRERERGLGT